MADGLEGKVAIVTGAARGLGREYAIQLAAAGCRVVVGDIRDCDETLKSMQDAGGEGLSVSLDVGDAVSCEAAAKAAEDAFSRIDVLVNNAALYGGLKGGRFETIPEDDWNHCMAINVNGVWNCCKAVVGAMRKTGGGSIINISSLAAVYGLPYALHYAVSKAAVIGITRSLARELGTDRIRVNAVAPTAVMTEGTSEFFGDKLDRAAAVISDGQTLKGNLETEDLAGTILYLAGDSSRFVTGQTIMVDGGTVYL